MTRAGSLTIHSFFFHGDQLYFVDEMVTTTDGQGGVKCRLIANRHGNKCCAAYSVVFGNDIEVDEVSLDVAVRAMKKTPLKEPSE